MVITTGTGFPKSRTQSPKPLSSEHYASIYGILCHSPHNYTPSRRPHLESPETGIAPDSTGFNTCTNVCASAGAWGAAVSLLAQSVLAQAGPLQSRGPRKGALKIRIGFWGPVYHTHKKDPAPAKKYY